MSCATTRLKQEGRCVSDVTTIPQLSISNDREVGHWHVAGPQPSPTTFDVLKKQLQPHLCKHVLLLRRGRGEFLKNSAGHSALLDSHFIGQNDVGPAGMSSVACRYDYEIGQKFRSAIRYHASYLSTCLQYSDRHIASATADRLVRSSSDELVPLEAVHGLSQTTNSMQNGGNEVIPIGGQTIKQ